MAAPGYTKRTSQNIPDAMGSNPWYHRPTNPCIDMWGPNGNCTTYAWGRISEILGKSSGLPTNNAREWWDSVPANWRSNTPCNGAVAVYGTGSNPNALPGHVAVIEELYDDGTVDISQSNYGGPLFQYLSRVSPTLPGWGVSLVGYIIHPDIPKMSKSKKLQLDLQNGVIIGWRIVEI